jgi:hypothetical protein
MEAWRKAGYTPLDKCAIAARAAALGRRTPAVMITASAKVRRFFVIVIVVESFIIAAHATYLAIGECSENKGCAFEGEVCGSC